MPFSFRRSRRVDHGRHRTLVDVVKSMYNPDNRRQSYPNKHAEYVDAPPSQAVRRHATHHHHPIAYLPNELLAHIFSLGTHDDTMFAVTVSHVCRKWRALALNTPSLWRHVALDARLDMWTERIRRAKACTLDIELSLRPLRAPFQQDVYPPFIDARDVQMCMHRSVQHITRWRSLDIRFEGYAPFLWNAALSACCAHSSTVHAHALTELTLIYPLNDDSKHFTLFDGVAPRLRRVTLYGVRLTCSPIFRNLRYLDYTHHGFSNGREAALEILLMLQASPRLETLRLAFPASGEAPAEPEFEAHYLARVQMHAPRPVPLTRLSALEVVVAGTTPDVPSSLLHLLYHLSMPSLRALRFSHAAPTSPAHLSRLRPVLAVLPTLPSLTYLRLAQRWLSPRFVARLVRTLPVHHLVLSGVVSRSLLRVFAEAIVARGVRLSVLELVRCTEVEVEAMAELVRGSWGPCVNEVWMRDCVVDTEGKGAATALWNLEARGVRVRVCTEPGQTVSRER